jgi:hypothetical protein
LTAKEVVMPFAGNFHPEWGYLAPAPSLVRSVRMVLVAAAVGATAGAGTVFALMDHAPVEARDQPVAAAPGRAASANAVAAFSGERPVHAGAQPQADTSAAAAAWSELNAAPKNAGAELVRPQLPTRAKEIPGVMNPPETKPAQPNLPPQTAPSRAEPAAETIGAAAAPADPAPAAEKKAAKKRKAVRRKPGTRDVAGHRGWSDHEYYSASRWQSDRGGRTADFSRSIYNYR